MIWIRKNYFIVILLTAVALAFVLPELGKSGGWLRSEWTTKLGVIAIFLMQGLRLPTRTLASGFFDWRLHLFIQGWSFVICPLIAWGLYLTTGSLFTPESWAGFWFLAVLPTTVSSAVTFTTVSGGNPAGAIFNTTLSNLLGVLIVPLYASLLFQTTSDGGSNILDTLWNLTKLIILPIIVGQIVRPLFSRSAGYKTIVSYFRPASDGIIIFIVFSTFCNSVAADTWNRFGLSLVALVLAVSMLFHVLATGGVWISSRWAGLSPSNRIAAFFCASQKSMAAGVPMANAIFVANSDSTVIWDVSLMILPLMCYHPIQLIVSSILVPRFKGMTDDNEVISS